MRSLSAAALLCALAAGAAHAQSVGDTVDVSWTGSTYTAIVTATRPGEYRIHYVGWEAKWDEWVTRDRIRAVRGRAVPKGAPAAAGKTSPAAWPKTPVGRYSCTTWDAGQLNVIAQFRLEAGGKYQDLMRRGAGAWTFDAKTRRVRFTSGPQRTSAPVVFDPAARGGKGWLEFTYPGGAKLHCYREALR